MALLDTATRATEGMVVRYLNEAAPRHIEAFLRAGDRQTALIYAHWLQLPGVRRGMLAWAAAVFSAALNDAQGFLAAVARAYNEPAYFEDGFDLSLSESFVQRGRDGRLAGAYLTFVEPATGRKLVQHLDGREDLYRYGIEALSPLQVFQTGLSEVEEMERFRQQRSAR